MSEETIPVVFPTFKVEKSTKTKNNSFSNKLVGELSYTVETAFGPATSTTKKTYYLFSEVAFQIGLEAALNLSAFDIIQRSFTPKDEEGNNMCDEDTGEVIVMTLDTLYPKRIEANYSKKVEA